MKHEKALQVAKEFVEKIRLGCWRIEIAGSVRRMKPEVKDIEIVAIPDLSSLPRPKLQFGMPVPRYFEHALDKLLAELWKAGEIDLKMNGERMKKIWLREARIWIDLFLVRAPAQWGVQTVIRTGPKEFGQWCVTPRKEGGALPDGYFVKHGVVWGERFIEKSLVPDDPNKAASCLIDWNHLEMPEEIDFLNFLDLGWIEPSNRIARWRK
jgi:hypothetical protein